MSELQRKTSTTISELTTAKAFYDEFEALKESRKADGLEVVSYPNFPDEETVVEFEEFFLHYGDNPPTLYNIDGLKIPRKKIVAIIGPSGCGKSTLLRSINRMNEEMTDVTSKGQIRVDGQDVYSSNTDKMRLRTKVGMIFQKPQPFPRSIYDNVAFGPKLHGIKHKDQLDEIVETSLKEVGMWNEVGHRLNDHAFGLSGGQQQRLCIARTIAVNPSIILADEPASALDPKSTFQIEELLLDLKQDFTVLIVTHNMQQAARISDYTFFMFNGVCVEYGPTDQIFENPFYDLTERYISGRFG